MPEKDENNERKLGLSARANLDVKTEIPAEVSGNLINALTDLIRPISEWTGFKGDQIRLQRLDTLIQIAHKANEIKRIENTPLVPVSTKFLVPFLEQGSREDINSEMIDWWAKLLSSASTAEDNQQPIYTNILASLTARQVKLASRLWEMTDQSVHISGSSASTIALIENKLESIGAYATKLSNETESNKTIDRYGILFAEKLSPIVKDFAFSGIFLDFVKPPCSKPINIESISGDPADYNALEILGVFKRSIVAVPVSSPWIGEFRSEVHFGMFTALGVKLMKICNPNLDD